MKHAERIYEVTRGIEDSLTALRVAVVLDDPTVALLAHQKILDALEAVHAALEGLEPPPAPASRPSVAAGVFRGTVKGSGLPIHLRLTAVAGVQAVARHPNGSGGYYLVYVDGQDEPHGLTEASGRALLVALGWATEEEL